MAKEKFTRNLAIVSAIGASLMLGACTTTEIVGTGALLTGAAVLTNEYNTPKPPTRPQIVKDTYLVYHSTGTYECWHSTKKCFKL